MTQLEKHINYITSIYLHVPKSYKITTNTIQLATLWHPPTPHWQEVHKRRNSFATSSAFSFWRSNNQHLEGLSCIHQCGCWVLRKAKPMGWLWSAYVVDATCYIRKYADVPWRLKTKNNWNITQKSYYVIVVAVIVAVAAAVPSWVLNQNAEIKSHWMPSLRHLMECFILLMKAAYSCPSFGSHQETLPIGATRRVLVSHLLWNFCDSCWRSYGTNCDNI